jgi:hypothetical protein
VRIGCERIACGKPMATEGCRGACVWKFCSLDFLFLFYQEKRKIKMNFRGSLPELKK